MGNVAAWVREGDNAYSFFSANRDLYVFARNKRDTFSLKQSEIERLQKVFFTNIQHKDKPFPADIVCKHLMTENPEVEECLAEVAHDTGRDETELCQAHEHMVRELLVETINLLKKPVEAAAYIYKVGCAHARFSKYQINPMWSKFYDSITECTNDWFVNEKHSEDEANWQLIISFVVAQLKLGYEEELTRKRQTQYRRPSANPPTDPMAHKENPAKSKDRRKPTAKPIQSCESAGKLLGAAGHAQQNNTSNAKQQKSKSKTAENRS